MKVALIEDGDVVVQDVPVPTPGDDEALIHIAAAGVCHSDLHLARGDWQGVPRSGSLGHEAIGTVEALGPGADRFVQVGDRVILGLGGTGGGFWCGACNYCLRGLPRHCARSKGIIGTFAEHFSVWAPSLVRLPDAVGDLEAPLACGGLTAYGAVTKLQDHQVVGGSRVAIVGAAGGLGHYGVQIARAFGYEVVGVDIGAERLEFVRSLGAEHVVDAADAVAFAQAELAGVDASIVFSSRMAGFHLGLGMLRKAALLVLVGLPPTSDGNLELNPFHLFMLDPTIVYSAVGTVQDMRELVDLAAAGKVTSHVARTGALSELPTIFHELEAGAYTGRAVITDLAG